MGAKKWIAVWDAYVSEDDMRLCYKRIVGAVKNGKSWAIKEMLDRTMGKPSQHVEHEIGTSIDALILQLANNAEDECQSTSGHDRVPEDVLDGGDEEREDGSLPSDS